MDFYFESLKQRVFELFSEVSEKERTHVLNVITNKIRQFNGDVCGVEISRTPFPAESGCFAHAEVAVHNIRVYIRITTD